MSQGQGTLFKDVTILDDVDVVVPEVKFKLIYNDDEGEKEADITTYNATRAERLVAYVVDSVTKANKLPLLEVNSFKSFAIVIRNFVLNLFNAAAKPIKYDNLVFDFRGLTPNNIAHQMIHIIPFCLHARNVANQDVYFLLDKVAPVFKELLDIFKIKPILTNRKVEASLIKIVVTRGFASYDAAELFDEAEPYSLLPNVYNEYQFSSGLKGTDKIFIARRGERGLLNLPEVEVLLKEYGYKTIFMEDYSMAVKLGISAEAKNVIAISGAGMGMLVLNKQINSLIEISPPNVYHDYFPCAIGRNTKKYIQIMSYFDPRTPYNDWSVILQYKSMGFSVDLKQLTKALKLVHFNNS